ncbi:MAG: hypothetical protein HFF39_10010 [Lawsonibacter sp.]|nr:hypothetical protein [Lawsonibacter sp.]
MSGNDRQNTNSPNELIDLKSLVKDADGGGYELDDILAEYGVSPPRAGGDVSGPVQPTPPACQSGKVVAFPGVSSLLPEDEEPEDADQEGETPEGVEPEDGELEEDGDEPEDSSQPPPSGGDKIIEFPEEESALGALFKDLKSRADHYADQMFEESEKIDPEEVRRLERLIPGTDQEEDPEEEQEDGLRYTRPPRRQEPPPPDLPPQELARRYARGLRGLRLRVLLLGLVTALAVALLLAPAAGLTLSPPLDEYPVQVSVCALLLAAGMLLGLDVLVQALLRTARLKFGMDTLTLLSCCFTLADAALLAVRQDRAGQLPYCAASLAALLMTVHGAYHKRCGLRLSCKTAAASAHPYLVTLDREKWNGRDTYVKWSGLPDGFGSQVQMDDGAQRIYRLVCPLLALACLLFSLLASVGLGKGEHLCWCLSATFTAAAALGGSLAFGRTFHLIARRLAQDGAALAGWPGAAGRRGCGVLICDTDLFPPGFVELNGIKVFGDFPVERVVGYTATLIRDSGSGLGKLFHDLLRSQGSIFRRAEQLACYEGGGLSALIRGDQVLVGSAAFMNLMEIPLPPGLNVKNAVFCAIDGELAGIFALSYSLPDTVFPSLAALLHEKVSPVLATRDFNIIPAMLQQRFKLAADRMDFPSIQRRRELSAPEQEHSAALTAVLCREGLGPFADAVVGARRLRRAARLGAAVCCAGSALGILLCAYLTSVDAYVSLSPLNLLVYLFTWLLPVWFLTDGAPRY